MFLVSFRTEVQYQESTIGTITTRNEHKCNLHNFDYNEGKYTFKQTDVTLDSCSGLVLKIDRTIDSVKLHGCYLNALLMFKAF